MNKAFPDATVDNFVELIPSLNLPDENDRHVLACAIRGKADLIATFNLRDFLKKAIEKFDIEAQSPDHLLVQLIDLNTEVACRAFHSMVNRLKNPTKTKSQVINTLKNCGLSHCAASLETQCSSTFR
ncbi:PIN domain-containing protein [Rapidithrix thailandica]|uniref:PIN domain-containing protein n=1 Tax=Rapidithrix thailandica TaxID=413964 RepID=A0AAW9SAU2_9BACT